MIPFPEVRVVGGASAETDAAIAKMKEAWADILPKIESRDFPPALKPALVTAEILYAVNGENIWPMVGVDYDRGAVPVPDDVDGQDVLPFMEWVLNSKEADAVHHVYVSVSDCLNVVLMTRTELYHAVAEITNGILGKWIFQTVQADVRPDGRVEEQ